MLQASYESLYHNSLASNKVTGEAGAGACGVLGLPGVEAIGLAACVIIGGGGEEPDNSVPSEP